MIALDEDDDDDDDDEEAEGTQQAPVMAYHGKQLRVGGKHLGSMQREADDDDEEEEEDDDDDDEESANEGANYTVSASRGGGKQLRPAGGKYMRP